MAQHPALVQATEIRPPRPDRRIGMILAAEGKLRADDIAAVLRAQGEHGLRFGETAVHLKLITREDLRRAIAHQYDVPHLLPGNRRVSCELVVAHEPFDRSAEQLRALRTQLLIRWANEAVRRRQLAIVSPGPAEGRSYLAANLAVAFAQLGDRTLLIDCDLRRPRQHHIFDVPDRIGLSALLAGRADHSAIVPLAELGRLWLLPAGARPPNPQELLSRDTFAALLEDLQAEFDVVLLDTPAACLYADAQTVAYRTGNALVLARKDYTSLADTAHVIGELADMGIRTVGTVYNEP
ncbi:MAG: polysaccharide biosynthesis tyrosine autokinase [Steroidobacteraceae bacterium]